MSKIVKIAKNKTMDGSELNILGVFFAGSNVCASVDFLVSINPVLKNIMVDGFYAIVLRTLEAVKMY